MCQLINTNITANSILQTTNIVIGGKLNFYDNETVQFFLTNSC